MHPILEKIPITHISSIAAKRVLKPYIDHSWHYHPEYEIILIEKSYGIRFLGNHIGNFNDGDLVFISSNLPHVWKNDKDFYAGNKDLFVDAYVIQFMEDALKEGFFDLPEFSHIKKLFVLGRQGVLIKGKDHKTISNLVREVVNAKGIDRLMLFIKTLDLIAKTKDFELLSSPGYTSTMNSVDTERINKVMNFITDNYAAEIDIEDIARLANLSVSSFCRYLKNRTHKTFSQVLNEVRIVNACKALVTSDKTITQICYSTGYNNISHFNRQFKLITGLTAKEYKNKYASTAM
jgi:AraC-like DNA-binding protein